MPDMPYIKFIRGGKEDITVPCSEDWAGREFTIDFANSVTEKLVSEDLLLVGDEITVDLLRKWNEPAGCVRMEDQILVVVKMKQPWRTD